MKCLLCKFISKNKSEIENHYINFHNVDKENVYFKKLLTKKTMFFLVKDVQNVMSLFQQQNIRNLIIF